MPAIASIPRLPRVLASALAPTSRVVASAALVAAAFTACSSDGAEAAGDDTGPLAIPEAGATMDATVSDAGPTPQPPQHGLRSDWFDDFSAFASTRYDARPGVDHDAKTAPAPGVRGTLYSVRWSGTLAAPVAGEYAFFVTADDGVRVFVDDEKVLEDWTSHAAAESKGTITLTAGAHALRVEYFQDTGPARLSVEWQPPGAARGPLPTDALTPATERPKDEAGKVLEGPRPTFENPVVPFDCPDPGVTVVPGEHVSFFMVCTGGKMRVRRSDDLVRWTDTAGFLLPGGKAAWSANGNRNWAPEIHKVGTKYVAYYTAVNGADRLSIGAASAPAPEGPYTDRGSALVEDPLGVIDATYFEDDDGKRYLYYKIDGNSVGGRTPIFVRELAADGLSFAPGSARVEVLNNDASTWEGGVVEAPWVFKHAGEYFLFYSGNVYDARYRTGVAKSKSPRGPFQKKGAPILANNASWVGPGHGSVFTVHGRDYYFHHAWPALPNGQQDNAKGRQGLVAQITWAAGWPVIAKGTPVTGPQLWP